MNPSKQSQPVMLPSRIFLSAGESSGDILASELAIEFQRANPDVEMAGVTGSRMRSAGVKSFQDISSLAVIGFSAAVAKISELVKLQKYLLAQIERFEPDLVVLVDYPGFHLHLGEQLRLRQIPVVQYVAPQVWGWGHGRAKKLRRQVDLLLGVLPFEEEFFRKFDVNFSYVGSPVFDRVRAYIKPAMPNSPEEKAIGFFPGSRSGEFRTLFPIMLDVARNLPQQKYRCYFSLASSLDARLLTTFLATLGVDEKTAKVFLAQETFEVNGFHFVLGNSLKLMKQVDFALVASGTATLECALIGTPLAAIYRVGVVNYWIVSRLLKSKYITLPNLVLDRPAIKEFVQHFSMAEITEHIQSHSEGMEFDRLNTDIAELRTYFRPDASKTACERVLQFYREHHACQPGPT